MPSFLGPRTRCWLVGTLAAAGVLVACSDGGTNHASPPTTAPTTTTRPVVPVDQAAIDAALAKAIARGQENMATDDRLLLAGYDFLARRFGISEFSNARTLALTRLGGPPGSQPEDRFVVPTARPSQRDLDDALRDGPIFVALTRSALACGEPGLPPEFTKLVRRGIANGGYDATHAALALQIAAGLGCDADPKGTLRRAAIAAIGREADRTQAVNDLSIEQLAVLDLLGAANRVSDAKVSAVVRAQLPDGSWPGPDAGIRRHTQPLGVWLLASRSRTATDTPFVVPG